MNRPVENYSRLDDCYLKSIRKEKYIKDLDEYCDWLEEEIALLKQKFEYFMEDYEGYIHPCKGCEDWCYKNQECKSKGGCGNPPDLEEKIDELTKALNHACLLLEAFDYANGAGRKRDYWKEVCMKVGRKEF